MTQSIFHFTHENTLKMTGRWPIDDWLYTIYYWLLSSVILRWFHVTQIDLVVRSMMELMCRVCVLLMIFEFLTMKSS